jgi:hypothetical protein
LFFFKKILLAVLGYQLKENMADDDRALSLLREVGVYDTSNPAVDWAVQHGVVVTSVQQYAQGVNQKWMAHELLKKQSIECGSFNNKRRAVNRQYMESLLDASLEKDSRVYGLVVMEAAPTSTTTIEIRQKLAARAVEDRGVLLPEVFFAEWRRVVDRWLNAMDDTEEGHDEKFSMLNDKLPRVVAWMFFSPSQRRNWPVLAGSNFQRVERYLASVVRSASVAETYAFVGAHVDFVCSVEHPSRPGRFLLGLTMFAFREGKSLVGWHSTATTVPVRVRWVTLQLLGGVNNAAALGLYLALGFRFFSFYPPQPPTSVEHSTAPDISDYLTDVPDMIADVDRSVDDSVNFLQGLTTTKDYSHRLQRAFQGELERSGVSFAISNKARWDAAIAKSMQKSGKDDASRVGAVVKVYLEEMKDAYEAALHAVLRGDVQMRYPPTVVYSELDVVFRVWPALVESTVNERRQGDLLRNRLQLLEQRKRARIQCVVCAVDATAVCAQCQKTAYCSPVCQREHWNTAHQHDCNKK